MKRIDVAFKFEDSGYIGKPFWPETNLLINISKDVHPKLGEAKKHQALIAACEKRGLTIEQYNEAVERSLNPFYTVNGRGTEIVIPERVFQSFLNHTSQEAPKAIPRIQSKGLTFISVRVENGYLRTGKTEADAQTFARFVKNQESNQRMYSEDKFIIKFTAEGIIRLDEETIKADELLKLVEFGGRMIGLGSGRPQGYGRFSVIRWASI